MWCCKTLAPLRSTLCPAPCPREPALPGGVHRPLLGPAVGWVRQWRALPDAGRQADSTVGIFIPLTTPHTPTPPDPQWSCGSAISLHQRPHSCLVVSLSCSGCFHAGPLRLQWRKQHSGVLYPICFPSPWHTFGSSPFIKYCPHSPHFVVPSLSCPGPWQINTYITIKVALCSFPPPPPFFHLLDLNTPGLLQWPLNDHCHPPVPLLSLPALYTAPRGLFKMLTESRHSLL